MSIVLKRKRKKEECLGVSEQTTILANQAAMNKQIEALTTEFQGFTLAATYVAHVQSFLKFSYPKLEFVQFHTECHKCFFFFS
jgi:hypothetical protein